jgi:hypothetical protein
MNIYRKRWIIGALIIIVAVGLFLGISAIRRDIANQITVEDILASQAAYENKFVEVRGILNTSFGLDECHYGNGILFSDKAVDTHRQNIWLHNASGYSLPQVDEQLSVIRGWFRQKTTPCKTPIWFIEVTEADLIETFDIPTTIPRIP